MKKQLKTIICLFLVSSITLCAQNKNPNSVLDFGVGLGPNYGAAGAKVLLGYRGSGVLFGYGALVNGSVISIGGQYTHKFLFVNFSVVTIEGDIPWSVTNYSESVVGMLGGKINVGAKRRFFFDLAAGLAKERYSEYLDFQFGLGFNVRIGS
ncbi:MAG: hypothetical protein RIC95_10455 [Vicingaceae bacterium]